MQATPAKQLETLLDLSQTSLPTLLPAPDQLPKQPTANSTRPLTQEVASIHCLFLFP